MKNIFIFSIFILFNNLWGSEVDVTLDHSNVIVLSDDSFRSYKKNSSDIFENTSISSLISTLKEEGEFYKKNTLAIKLELCSLTDENLARIVDEFLLNKNYKDKIRVVDLSFNNFTEKSRDSIKKILEIENLLYLKILGTVFQLKKIETLLRFLNDKDHSKKIVFMKKSYVKKAKEKLQIYRNLENEGLLDESWDKSILYFYDHEKELVPSSIPFSLISRMQSFHL